MNPFGSFEDCNIVEEEKLASGSINIPYIKTQLERMTFRCNVCERQYQAFSIAPVCPKCKKEEKKEVLQNLGHELPESYDIERAPPFPTLNRLIRNDPLRNNRDRGNVIFHISFGYSESFEDSEGEESVSSYSNSSENILMRRPPWSPPDSSRSINLREALPGRGRELHQNLIERHEAGDRLRGSFGRRPGFIGFQSRREIGNLNKRSKAAIKNLKSIRINEKHCSVNDETGKFEAPCCCICTDEMKLKADKLPCDHLFHSECIIEWLNKHPICPLCRTSFN
ncbi:unnamed protein product [Moneuplotes crassus]|uniref:RING-type domain-containing protein n=1 Tax=Euplotes crassus TaxID=5936 RepID=A0AAD1XR10_EUPCR|nr:unnamed protein product [Moneuplotes crassus]